MGENDVIDWVIALFAALIGGGLSAFGAWLAVGRQINAQDEKLTEIARSFFAFIIEDDIARLDSLVSYRSANSGAVALFDLSMLLANYQIFERNREHLVRLVADERKPIADIISQVQTIAFAIQSAEQERSNAEARLQGSLSEVEKLAEGRRLADANDRIAKGFAFIPDLISQLRRASTDAISFKRISKNG